MLKAKIWLTILLISTSASSARTDAIYITNDLFDENLIHFENQKQNYKYWPDAPFQGILMSVDDFTDSLACLNSCRDLEIKGLDALGKIDFVDSGPTIPSGFLYFMGGVIAGGLVVYFTTKY